MTEQDLATETPDWTDRLIDQGLRETVGGETPPEATPELVSAILAAHDDRQTTPSGGVDSTGTLKQRYGWMRWATAASVSFLAGAIAATGYHSHRPEGVVVRVDEPIAEQSNDVNQDYSLHRYSGLDKDEASSPDPRGVTAKQTAQDSPSPPATASGALSHEARHELVLSEGIGLHDRRVEDSADYSSTPQENSKAAAKANDDDYLDQLMRAKSAGIADEPPIAYPDHKTWQDLTDRRKKYAEADQRGGLRSEREEFERGIASRGRQTDGEAGLAKPRPQPLYGRFRKDGIESGSAVQGFAGKSLDTAQAPGQGVDYGLADPGDSERSSRPVPRAKPATEPMAQGFALAIPPPTAEESPQLKGEPGNSKSGGQWFGGKGEISSDGVLGGGGLGVPQESAPDLPKFSSDLDAPLRQDQFGVARAAIQRERAEIRQLAELRDQSRLSLRQSGETGEKSAPVDTRYRRQLYAYWEARQTPGEDQLASNLSDFDDSAKVPERQLRQIELKVVDEISEEISQRRKRLERVVDRLSAAEQAEGQGPGAGGDQYTAIHENPFMPTRGEDAVSTFSIDVDTASYANVRQFLNSGQLPPPDAVRLEELINYFDYGYAAPKDADAAAESGEAEATGESAPSSQVSEEEASPENDGGEPAPFAAHVEVAGCPWTPAHRLVRIGLKGREIDREKRPLTNLVFLIDVSGSMNNPQKHPLVIEGLKALAKQLGENDRVAIVVYASQEGLALPSITGSDQETILAALDNLRAGGSTAGGAGIRLAYQIAQDHFIQGGVNRVILCTDGDFNVGTTSTAELERLVTKNAKETGVFLSVCGFGRGNLNDAMMETISGKGNGNYYYVDSIKEAEKVFVKGLTGTLVTIAKDVKIQVEFNPAKVAGYRLLGYENRMLETQDFNDDKKDAGEIGAGHTVTALYEIVPAGEQVPAAPIDELKYQRTAGLTPEAAASDETLTLKMRYKQPDEDVSTKLEWPVKDAGQKFGEASADLQFAASVASFGMQLRGSKHAGDATLDAVQEIAEATLVGDDESVDPNGYRAEFVELVKKAKQLRSEE